MSKPPPFIATRCPRSRAAAILGLVALALLQVSFAAHAFEHSAEHGLNVCHACTAYSQLEDAPGADSTPFEIEIAPNSVPYLGTDSPELAVFAAAYRSRAPPTS